MEPILKHLAKTLVFGVAVVLMTALVVVLTGCTTEDWRKAQTAAEIAGEKSAVVCASLKKKEDKRRCQQVRKIWGPLVEALGASIDLAESEAEDEDEDPTAEE